MVFSSLTFLFAYLPLVLAVYVLVPAKARNAVLFIVSLFFYGWGEPVYVLVMLASITVNWLFGLAIGKARDRQTARRRLVLCLVFNLALLGFFKYADFLIENLNRLGLHLRPLHIHLPIGISFYTFQTMSYPIDLYRGKTEVQHSWVDFGTYVSMFPQLIAGPIVRYTEIAAQLKQRVVNRENFSAGISRFCCGLCKKVLLANQIGELFEDIQQLGPQDQSLLTAWLGITAFAFQIYFDFSGYSDMAVGLGKMLGFSFPENFNYPYTSRSVTDFWRRWHMTLSYWFRDYVYIPLGGNRRGLKRQILNILIVWLLTGLWHGASWNFVLWGLYYGLVLILEKLFLLKKLEKAPAWVGHVYTILIVWLGWVLFAFPDLSRGTAYLACLFGSTGVLANGLTLFYLRDHLLLLAVCVIACMPRPKKLFRPLLDSTAGAPLLTGLSLLACTACIVNSSYNPFLYFRF